ncbi:carboxymuconolactone decarboxylase family protein [Brevibacillus humidisoli]|uniref:carboxymuconolactone decarboxylase family protein n=1 Tax=Brevibacillus humidisoli TaxID=2895522 RepID=UPI001E608699|nr:carboxymuconolactone decarboxylase family protein [Brevibacillus humidisoli]UFJ43070.1 carboxymuconolactone decarboxylase family protein [Brevibacillus humidisoli]
MTEHYLAEQYREGLHSLGELMPEVVDAYNRFTNVCFQPGEVSTKYKHLMALGISLFTGNEHCIVYHLENALDEGATEKEIAETISVAGAYGGGATMSHGVILINEVMEEKRQNLQ